MANLPDPVLDKLRCHKCKNFLSCKPILITEDGQSLCGRCRSSNASIRAHIYECVADYFLFPCKNWEQHCAYLLNIKDVIEHENGCPYGSCCSLLCFNPGSLCKSDNKLDLSQNIKFYNIPEQEVLDTLTCTLCGYYLSSSPVHVNGDQMSMCHRCYRSKEGKVSPSYVRHYALENILQIFLFPCVYRRRGCTKVFRFGLDTDHEEMCSYSKTQRSFTTYTDPNSGKHKGVIETHSGHTFGTITPYSQFFVAQNKVSTDNYKAIEPIKMVPNQKQERFFNELIKHRDSLQYQWNRNSKIDGSNSPPRMQMKMSNTAVDPIDEVDTKSRTSSERPSFGNDVNRDGDRQNFYRSDLPGLSREDSIADNRFPLRRSPVQDGYYENENSFRTRSTSPPRVTKSTSSWSDTFDSRESPESTISSQPIRSPLRLNPNELMYSDSFNYSERLPSQIPNNPSFRN